MDRADLILIWKVLTIAAPTLRQDALFKKVTTISLSGQHFKHMKGLYHLYLRRVGFSQRLVNQRNERVANVVAAPSVGIYKSRLEQRLSR